MNKKASLMDTRQCDPSYFIARKPEGIELETSNYEFDSLEDIETYWYMFMRLASSYSGTRLYELIAI